MSDMFIPPLETPQPSPRNPPVLPGAGAGTPPAWAMTPQTPGHYPIFPGTPMMGTPFIPTFTPAGATPAMLPRGTPGSIPAILPNGQSVDYTGYPHFTQPSPWGTPSVLPSMMPPGTPWHAPNSAPLMAPQGTPWPSVPQGLPGGGGYGQPGGMPPALAMGGMGPQMMGGWPTAPPSGNPYPWGQPPQVPVPQPSAWDMGPMQQALPPQPQAPLQPLARAGVNDRTDVLDQFSEGPNYGPVLEPFLTRVVEVNPKINPLLLPPDDSNPTHLKWDMLWPSNMVQRSDEATHVSWSRGRHAPATFPRITSLRLVTATIPFTIEVMARNPEVGVTCGDVIDTISDSMRKHTGQSEFNCLPPTKRRQVGESYRHNRGRAHGVPGGALGEGLRRMDFLGLETMFGGIDRDDRLVRQICGEVLPCTYNLHCIHRYPMTQGEIDAHDARVRAQEEERRIREEEREHARRRRRDSHAPTVETVTDEDDLSTRSSRSSARSSRRSSVTAHG